MQNITPSQALAIALNLLGMVEVRGSANIKHMAQAMDILEKVQDVYSSNKTQASETSDHNKTESSVQKDE